MIINRCPAARKEDRQASAAKRLEESQNRTPEQQLALLDASFGEGQGATKERLKLAERIARG